MSEDLKGMLLKLLALKKAADQARRVKRSADEQAEAANRAEITAEKELYLKFKSEDGVRHFDINGTIITVHCQTGHAYVSVLEVEKL